MDPGTSTAPSFACGAPAFVSLKRDYDCKSGSGPYRVRFKHHSGYHKARVEAAEALRSRILAEGESAAAELALAKPAAT